MKWLIGIMIIAIIVAGGYFFLNGIQSIAVEKFELNKINKIDTDSFTLNGNIFVKNPSNSQIPIQKIEYEVYLKETNEKIGDGRIEGFVLEPNKVTIIPFDQVIRWSPSISIIEQLLTKDKVMVEVKGKLRVNIDSIKNQEIPFASETDIKEYFENKIRDPNTIRNLIN